MSAPSMEQQDETAGPGQKIKTGLLAEHTQTLAVRTSAGRSVCSQADCLALCSPPVGALVYHGVERRDSGDFRMH